MDLNDDQTLDFVDVNAKVGTRNYTINNLGVLYRYSLKCLHTNMHTYIYHIVSILYFTFFKICHILAILYPNFFPKTCYISVYSAATLIFGCISKRD